MLSKAFNNMGRAATLKRAFSSVSVKLPEVEAVYKLDADLIPKTAETNKEEMRTYFE